MRQWSKKELKCVKIAMMNSFFEDVYHVAEIKVKVCREQIKIKKKVKFLHFILSGILIFYLVYFINEWGSQMGLVGNDWLLLFVIICTASILIWKGMYHFLINHYIKDDFIIQIIQQNIE